MLLHTEMSAYVRNCPHHLTFPEAPHSKPKAKLSRCTLQHYIFSWPISPTKGKGGVTKTYKL